MHPRTRKCLFAWRTPIVILVTATLAACGDGTTAPTEESPLKDLTQSTARDSAGMPRTGEPSTTGPGIVRGTVMGLTGRVPDTVAVVAGARVAAFPVTGGTEESPTLGREAGSTTSGTNGKFTLPSLVAGKYVVTVTPPASSSNAGVWMTSYISTASDEHPWWIVLPRK